MKTKLNFLFIPVGFILLLFGINFHQTPIHFQNHQDTTTIKLNFVGDLMCHMPQIDYAKVGKDSFDFKTPFSEVKKYLEDADLTFGNFETVIADSNKRYSGYPTFNSPVEYLEGIKNSGFDILFTSNNHSADGGVKGILRTIDAIKKYGMIPIGTNSTQQERDSVLILDVKGIKIGLNSYTYGLNGNVIPKSKSFSVNLIDTTQILSDIKKMRSKNPDLILIYFHFGEEYSRKPSAYQKEIVNKTFNYGADIIIASHPHVIQPAEYFVKKNGKLKKGLIAYSLGNFFSNQQWRYSDAGVILNLEIKKINSKDSLWINKMSFTPTWVFKGNTDRKKEFIILPADTSLLKPLPGFIHKEELNKLNQAFEDTRKMFPAN